MSLNILNYCKLFIALTLTLSFSSMADIVIIGTRVIYPEEEREVTIRLDNLGDKESLAQVWVDSGDPDATPETAKAPFTITPPISRINGGKSQVLRMIYTGERLPSNKESLFWLNVLEIPATKYGKKNELKLAIRSRIKIFYRPHELTGNSIQAGKKIMWKKVRGGIEAYNPTPYFVSLANISEDNEGKSIIASGGMISPRGKRFFSIKKDIVTIYPSYITDGGTIDLHAQNITN